MQTITTTQLRTRSKDLVETLLGGESVELIHRSKIIGEIKPKDKKKRILTEGDLKEFDRLIEIIKPEKIIPKGKREGVYRKNLAEKYGVDIS